MSEWSNSCASVRNHLLASESCCFPRTTSVCCVGFTAISQPLVPLMSAHSARFFTISSGYKLIFYAYPLDGSEFHSSADQHMVSTQPGSAQPHRSCGLRVLCGSSETHVCLTMEYERPPENSAKGHFCFHDCLTASPCYQTPCQYSSTTVLSCCKHRARWQAMLRHTRRAVL